MLEIQLKVFIYSWINGQHLRSLPNNELNHICGDYWKKSGLLQESEGPFINVSTEIKTNKLISAAK
jgi:hypothetical protein